MTRYPLACLIALLAACDGGSDHQEDAQADNLVPLNSQRPGWADTQSVPQPLVPPSVARAGCVTPGHAALRGVVRQEVRFGAPGYGEDTLTDARDTVVVLQLRDSLVLCRDSVLDAPGSPPLRVARVTLRYVPREILALRGSATTVFGRLEEAGFAFEQGPVLLRVDSVPALRQVPRKKAS